MKHVYACAGLEQAGQMRGGETVLVTAAAGGTGQFVVQLAKAAGNAIVATCGSDDKAALLRRLGADRVVNYRKENLKDVLRREYPKVPNSHPVPTRPTSFFNIISIPETTWTKDLRDLQ